MADVRQSLREQLTRYQRQTQGQGDFLEEALARAATRRGEQPRTAEGFIPVRPQTQSFQPQQSAAERARLGFEAAALQAADYPALGEVGAGMLGALGGDREAARAAAMERGGPITPLEAAGASFGAGAGRFRGATPSLDPWRGEVSGRTEAALQAGVPLAGILGAGMLLGGLGPEDAALAGTRVARGALLPAKAGLLTPAQAMTGVRNADQAIGAARAAARNAIPTPVAGGSASPLAAMHADEAARAATRTAREAVEQTTGIPESGMAAPKTQRAIPRVRLMEREAAQQAAEESKHLIKGPDGSYVGAPEWVKTPRSLKTMRERIDKYARTGAQWIDPATQETLKGYDWYTRGQRSIEALFPDDPQAQADFATAIGIFSENVDPKGNFRFATRAMLRNQLGAPQIQEGVPSAGTANQIRRFDKYMGGSSRTVPLGNKTLPYTQQLDPTTGLPLHTSANDMIVGRVYGFGDESFARGLSDSEHAFVDAEQLLAVKRLNKEKFLGRDDWTVGELQASQWMARRAEDLLSRGQVQTLEEGLTQSADDFSAFFSGERVFFPNESTPGVPGVAPDYASLPFDQRQRQLSSAMRPEIAPSWRDEQGRDIMLRGMGLPTLPTQRGLAGFWPTEQGVQMNPMEAAVTLGDFVPGPHGRELAPYYKRFLERAVTVRAYTDAQAAGSAVAFVPMLKSTSTGAAGDAQDALAVTIGRALSEPEMQQIAQLADSFGWNVVSHDKGFYMFPSAGEWRSPKAPGGKQLQANMAQVQNALQQALGGQQANVTRGRIESVYETVPWGEIGSGTATTRLKSLLSGSDEADRQLALLDTPELRKKARNQLRFMRRLMDSGNAVRSDLVNALAVMSEGGLRGLFDAAAKGTVPLPSIMLVWGMPEIQAELAKALGRAENEEGPPVAEEDEQGVEFTGQPTINMNAQKQMDEALRNQ